VGPMRVGDVVGNVRLGRAVAHVLGQTVNHVPGPDRRYSSLSLGTLARPTRAPTISGSNVVTSAPSCQKRTRFDVTTASTKVTT
jgi:hypothetical protein